MKADQEFDPAWVAQQSTIPSIGGGNGCIHSPGGYRNLVWQSQSCAPTPWTLAFIARLETLFEQGIETLPALVPGLNSAALYDQQGQPWQEATLRAFFARKRQVKGGMQWIRRCGNTSIADYEAYGIRYWPVGKYKPILLASRVWGSRLWCGATATAKFKHWKTAARTGGAPVAWLKPGRSHRLLVSRC